MSLKRYDLLKYMLEDKKINPTSENFKPECEKWISEKFPSASEKSKNTFVNNFCDATRKKWKLASRNKKVILGDGRNYQPFYSKAIFNEFNEEPVEKNIYENENHEQIVDIEKNVIEQIKKFELLCKEIDDIKTYEKILRDLENRNNSCNELFSTYLESLDKFEFGEQAVCESKYKRKTVTDLVNFHLDKSDKIFQKIQDLRSKYGVQTRSINNSSQSTNSNKNDDIKKSGDGQWDLNDCSKYKSTYFVCPEKKICSYQSQDISEFRNHIIINHNVIHGCISQPPKSTYAVYNPFLNQPSNYTIEYHVLEMMKNIDEKG